jgi:hypothetical protein
MLRTVCAASTLGSTLQSRITNGARFTCEIECRTAVAKAAPNKTALFTTKLDLHLRKELVKCKLWGTALCGAESSTLRKVDQKYRERFQMWCWGRVEKISWTDRGKNEEALQRVRRERNNAQTVKSRKAV